ncbi:MAG: cytochrome c oxidase subunit II [Gemmatimonadales bacterium]
MPLASGRLPRLTYVVILLISLGLAGCSGEFPQTVFEPTSDFGRSVDTLFRNIIWWALFVFVVVEGVLLYTIVRFRAKPGAPAPKHIHGHTALEIAWTLAPAFILVFIAVPTIRTIFEFDGTPAPGALEIEVIGHQWWWEYRYPEYGITTASEMHLPQGRPIALKMTSADVIHAFWVPRLGGKRDVIMGHTTRLAFTVDSTGVYMGQCAEFCGESHANMRLSVSVDSLDDFAAWVAGQQAPPVTLDTSDQLLARGAAAFQQVRDPASNSCVACHTISGISFGVLGPNLTHLASRNSLAGGILPNDADGLRRWLADPSAEKPGSLMPNIDLTSGEIDALVAYLQSLR